MVTQILDKCRLIAETTGTIGQRRNELQRDLRSFPVPPHVIYFRFERSKVEVLRILHGRRDVRPDLF
jgi:plasmid stabilization system protein ParE